MVCHLDHHSTGVSSIFGCGLLGFPPDAKLPRTHELLICRHRLGYLTATTEWFVTGLTRELDGSMSPHAWESLTPAVWQLSSAWISLVIGSKVSTCCRIQANRFNDRERCDIGVVSSFRKETMAGCTLTNTPLVPPSLPNCL